MAAPATPPRKTAGTPLRTVVDPPPKPAPKVETKTPRQRRQEGLTELFQFGAALAMPFPAFRPDAAVIVQYGPALAEEAAAIADEDSRAAALLDRITTMGPYGKLLGITVQMGLQIAANHGLIKPGFMGTLPPRDFVTAVIGEEVASPDESIDSSGQTA